MRNWWSRVGQVLADRETVRRLGELVAVQKVPPDARPRQAAILLSQTTPFMTTCAKGPSKASVVTSPLFAGRRGDGDRVVGAGVRRLSIRHLADGIAHCRLWRILLRPSRS